MAPAPSGRRDSGSDANAAPGTLPNVDARAGITVKYRMGTCMEATSVTSKGQVTIPKAVRRPKVRPSSQEARDRA
jgi:hypothetical protein